MNIGFAYENRDFMGGKCSDCEYKICNFIHEKLFVQIEWFYRRKHVSISKRVIIFKSGVVVKIGKIIQRL